MALSATIYLVPLVLVLLGIWLARDLWPPFRQVTVLFFLGWLLAFILDPLAWRARSGGDRHDGEIRPRRRG